MNLVMRWSHEIDDATVASFAADILPQLDNRAKALGLYYPFINLNDAGTGEDPFSLYGSGKSLEIMRATRMKYDPTALFQTLQAGGFKLGI